MLRIINRLDELLARKGRKEGRRISKRVMAEETGLGEGSLKLWGRNAVQKYDGVYIAVICRYLECGVDELLMIVEDDDEEEAETKAALLVAV